MDLNSFCVRVSYGDISLFWSRPLDLDSAYKLFTEKSWEYLKMPVGGGVITIDPITRKNKRCFSNEWIEETLKIWKGDIRKFQSIKRFQTHCGKGNLNVQLCHACMT